MECRICNVNIYYEEIGAGKPVVMLHGFSPDHRLMMGCMEPVWKMRKGYRRIYPDLPGMGRSGHADWMTGSDSMLDAVTAFIEKVVPDGKFLLAGESYGGYLSRGVVYRMKERVDGLLLICPVIIPDYPSRDVRPHAVLYRDQELLSGLSPEDANDFDDTAVVENRKIYERYRVEVVSGLQIADQKFLKRIKANYAFPFDVDEASKARLEKPVLLLAGRQDACVGYRDAFRILENYPRATFAVLDMAGHNLQIEQPGLFSSMVNDWISRTEI